MFASPYEQAVMFTQWVYLGKLTRICGLGDGSVGRLLAAQAWGSRFRFLALTGSVTCLWSQNGEGRGRRIPRTCLSAIYPNWQTPICLKDSVSKTKVKSEGEWWLVLTFGLHMCICVCTNSCNRAIETAQSVAHTHTLTYAHMHMLMKYLYSQTCLDTRVETAWPSAEE